jgi:O-antigen ligase
MSPPSLPSSVPLAPHRAAWSALLAACVLAAGLPTLLALHQPPSATLLNQCLAVALWGSVVAVLAPSLRPARGIGALLTALGLVAAAAAGSWLWGLLPRSLALQALGLLAGAALMLQAGAAASRDGTGPQAFAALAWGLLAAGVLGAAVALVQVFAPGWADGTWIAVSGLPGRAVGNLRQPNHLCSLLLWALAAAVALHALRRLPGAALAVLVPLLVLCVELTASRTGAAGLALLLLWGLVDRRLPRGARVALLAAPVLYGLCWALMAWWGDVSQQALGAGARLAADGASAGGDSPNARPNIWRNALLLIAAHPWTGTGFGEFNLAWSMTPFVNRPTAFFDHTHNLPLQLMVELGMPLALGVLALLALALWQAWRRAADTADDAAAVAGRAALVLVLLTGLHSLVEYPLWYAYFLLPTALAWGLVLGLPAARPPGQPAQAASRVLPERASAAGLVAGLLMAAAGLLAVLDYQRAVVIYAPTDGSGSLASRIARGQLSPLFAHHADYAAATNAVPPASRALGLVRATHALLDTRLMMAWARGLAEAGHVDEARWVAQRLRDFRNPDAAEFFAPCGGGPPGAPEDGQPFQCQAPLQSHSWRHLASLPPLLPQPAAAPGQPAASATQ